MTRLRSARLRPPSAFRSDTHGCSNRFRPKTRCRARAIAWGLCALVCGGAGASNLSAELLAQAPGLDAEVLALALAARDCAAATEVAERSPRLAVIDYSLPSTEVRLWVFDLEHQRLLHAEHVAHGRGSGDNHATAFSNIEGSHQTSLGLFRTDRTYVGANGYSLRMDGLDPGFNDRARERAIVMHGADYVDPQRALAQGRLGRSHGCPAVRTEIARPLIDDLRDGQLLFAYYPDPEWLARSQPLACLRQARAQAGGQAGGAVAQAAQ